MAQRNGIVGRALSLLTGRKALAPQDAALLRKAGREYVESLSDEELQEELERRARVKLFDIGRTELANLRPPRPETPFTERIQERREREPGLREVVDEALAAEMEAREVLRAATRRHPPDELGRLQALEALREAERVREDAERAWKRCRSGRIALQLSEDKYLGDREYLRSIERRRARR